MTVVDQIRVVLDSDNESGDEEEEGDDNDTSEISMPARLREACSRKSEAADQPWCHTAAAASLRVTTSSAASLLTGHGSLHASLAVSQRNSVPLFTLVATIYIMYC